MTFGRVMLWGAVQSAIRLAAGIATTKILSVYLGPAGLAVFAQFQTFAGLLNNFVNGGIQQGIVKHTADARDDPARLLRLSRTIALLSLAFTIALAVPIVLWRAPLAAWLFKAPNLETPLLVYALIMFATAACTALSAQLNGLHLPVRVFVAQSVFALTGLGLAALLTPKLGLFGALLSIPLAQLGFLIPLLIAARKVEGMRLANWRPALDSAIARQLLGFGLLLFVTALALSGSQLYVRDLLIHAHSADIAGHWQAVLRVSEPVVIIATSVLTPYYLPRLSSAPRAERNALLRHYFRLIMPLFALGAILVVIFRDTVILIMFTPAFLPAADLFVVQFAGDAVRMAGWIANIALLAAGRTRAVMASEIVFAACFIGSAVLLVPRHGAWGGSAAYLIANVAACAVLWGVVARGEGGNARAGDPPQGQ